MESLMKFVQDEFVTKNENPEFSAGDTITVYYEIKETRPVPSTLRVWLSKKEEVELPKPLRLEKCLVLLV